MRGSWPRELLFATRVRVQVAARARRSAATTCLWRFDCDRVRRNRIRGDTRRNRSRRRVAARRLKQLGVDASDIRTCPHRAWPRPAAAWRSVTRLFPRGVAFAPNVSRPSDTQCRWPRRKPLLTDAGGGSLPAARHLAAHSVHHGRGPRGAVRAAGHLVRRTNSF